MQEGLDGVHGLGLLFCRRDGSGWVPLLQAVVAELGVVPAFDFHHMFGVVQFVFHALVERAVDGQGIFRRLIPVEIGPQQDQTVHLLWMRGGEF